jgi:hypothetical protein
VVDAVVSGLAKAGGATARQVSVALTARLGRGTVRRRQKETEVRHGCGSAWQKSGNGGGGVDVLVACSESLGAAAKAAWARRQR